MASRFASRRAKLALLAMSALLSVVLAEVGAQLLWHRRGVPMLDPGKILYAYYPPLAAIDANPPTRDDGTFEGRGIYGQTLHIDPARRLVIVINSATEEPTGRAAGQARQEFIAAVNAELDAR